MGFAPDDKRVKVVRGADAVVGIAPGPGNRDGNNASVTAPLDDFLRAMVLGDETDTMDDPESLRLEGIMDEVYSEVERAIDKHPPMNSAHEGHSVIREELDELWDEVKADRGNAASARKEAIQIACTAIRYVLDLDPSDPE